MEGILKEAKLAVGTDMVESKFSVGERSEERRGEWEGEQTPPINSLYKSTYHVI